MRKSRNAQFEGIRKLAYKLARAAIRDSPLTFDEALSAAMLGCAQALETHVKRKGRNLTAWAYTKIRCRLLDEMGDKYSEIRRDKNRIPMELFDAPTPEFPEWDSEQDWITDDIDVVLRKIMLPTGDVLRAIRQEAKAELVRNTVRAELRKAGWKNERIRSAFVAIKANLG